MLSKEHKLEEMVGKLREVEVLLVQGAATAETCRGIRASQRMHRGRLNPA